MNLKQDLHIGYIEMRLTSVFVFFNLSMIFAVNEKIFLFICLTKNTLQTKNNNTKIS